jgi:hypothetical protein
VADNFVLSTCKKHEDCTIRAYFLPMDDPYSDPVTDQKPISAWIQENAEHAFGPCWCVEVEHLPGKIAIGVET